MPNNYCLQLLSCEVWLLVFVLWYSKLNLFGFWTVDQTKQEI